MSELKTNRQIVFTKKDTAEFLVTNVKQPGPSEVLIETAFSMLSCGTEKANITGDPNVAPDGPSCVKFPRYLGYSSSGVVVCVGENVKSVKPGDRVAAFGTVHAKYNTRPESDVVKIDDAISLQEAAMGYVTTFPMAAVRKTRVEIGESAIVMGLGLLGQLAVRYLRIAGAMPIVAVDPVKERREEALQGGADYAFDPFEPDFSTKVKEVTDGGANVGIEVTGVGAGLDGILDCMARFGRVSLLGCTRNKDFSIDFYKKVHFPGITLIGAHTDARPEHESSGGWFTHRDDINAVMKLCRGGRLDLLGMIKETHSPKDCVLVYQRLISDKNFPTVVQFDWRDIHA